MPCMNTWHLLSYLIIHIRNLFICESHRWEVAWAPFSNSKPVNVSSWARLPPTPDLNWGWNRAKNCRRPLGCHSLGCLILCAPKVTRPAVPSTRQTLLHFRVLSAPHAAACGFPPSPPSPGAEGVGWPPWGCLRSKESVWLIPGEVLSSQGQYGNSGWQQCCLHRGEASPGSLLPSGKPLECEKRHLSCQGGLECKAAAVSSPRCWLWALHLPRRNSDSVSIQQSPHASAASQAFPGTLPQAGYLKEAAWILPKLWGVWKCNASFQNQLCSQAVWRNETETGIFAQGEVSSCVNTYTCTPDVIRQKTMKE